MGDEALHPRDVLQDALDHRLAPKELRKLDAHVRSCERCRGELEALRWTKARASSARSIEAPSDLEARLRQAFDREDKARARVPSRSRAGLRGWAPWLAAAAGVVAAVWIGGRFWMSAVPGSVAGLYRDFASGAIPLEIASTDPAELERFFLRRGLPFKTRVFDLGMMGYRLEGGGVRPVDGEDGALIAYRAAGRPCPSLSDVRGEGRRSPGAAQPPYERRHHVPRLSRLRGNPRLLARRCGGMRARGGRRSGGGPSAGIRQSGQAMTSARRCSPRWNFSPSGSVLYL